jgi:hypothetical protein
VPHSSQGLGRVGVVSWNVNFCAQSPRATRVLNVPVLSLPILNSPVLNFVFAIHRTQLPAESPFHSCDPDTSLHTIARDACYSYRARNIRSAEIHT